MSRPRLLIRFIVVALISTSPVLAQTMNCKVSAVQAFARARSAGFEFSLVSTDGVSCKLYQSTLVLTAAAAHRHVASSLFSEVETVRLDGRFNNCQIVRRFRFPEKAGEPGFRVHVCLKRGGRARQASRGHPARSRLRRRL